MKTNKERIYDFIELQASAGVDTASTQEIAEALKMKRPNVSAALNELTKEKKLLKSNGRPVMYRLATEKAETRIAFHDLVGWDGSLRQAVELAQAVVTYPGFGLNVLLISNRGCGKNFMAKVMYQAGTPGRSGKNIMLLLTFARRILKIFKGEPSIWLRSHIILPVVILLIKG